jgi:hypothetical protein
MPPPFNGDITEEFLRVKISKSRNLSSKKWNILGWKSIHLPGHLHAPTQVVGKTDCFGRRGGRDKNTSVVSRRMFLLYDGRWAGGWILNTVRTPYPIVSYSGWNDTIESRTVCRLRVEETKENDIGTQIIVTWHGVWFSWLKLWEGGWWNGCVSV